MPLIEANGFAIDLLDQGDGEPIVLVHSTGMAAGQWRAVISHLNDRFRLLAPNLHGYGRSTPWPEGRRLDLAAEAALLRGVIGYCGAPVHLVGHSYGGLLALSIVRTAPRDLASLALIEPMSVGVLRSEREDGALSEVDRMQRLFFAAFDGGDAAGAMENFVDYWYGAGAWQMIPLAQRLPIFARAQKMYREIESVWADRTPLDAYRSIRTPTLVLVGERTTPAARKIADLLAGGIPSAVISEISGGTHMLPVTHADIVADLIAGHAAKYSIK